MYIYIHLHILLTGKLNWQFRLFKFFLYDRFREVSTEASLSEPYTGIVNVTVTRVAYTDCER